MRLKTKSVWIDRALEHMLVDNAAGASILSDHEATSCTDVTGFGLLGHLLEMTPAELSVTLMIDEIPVLAGAIDTAQMGILSSIHTDNHAASEAIENPESYVDNGRYPLLFDPQTSGGLLATVAADKAEKVLEALRAAGYAEAAMIGRVRARVAGERAVRLS